MSIIDTTYFNGPINVPQLGKSSVDNGLQLFINRYEPRILQAALGYQLYLDFMAGLKATPIDQKWLDLRDGVVFTATGMWPPFYWQYPFLSVYRNWFIPQNPVRKMEWIGWTGRAGGSESDDPIYTSPIAGYVYYEYTRDQVTQNTGLGIVTTPAENAADASPGFKMQDAFNQMSKDVFSLWQLFEADAVATVPKYTSYERLKINYAFFQTINRFNI